MLQYHHYAELAAMASGLLLLRKNWPIPYKMLSALASLTFIVELTGHILWTQFHQNNNWLYNIFVPIQVFTFLWIIYASIQIQKIRKGIRWCFIVMVAGTGITYFWHDSFKMLNNHAITLYWILLIIACCSFYIDAIENTIQIPLLSQPVFWLSSGILFFCAIFVVRTAIWNLMPQLYNFKQLSIYSNIVANTFMYSGIIACFICLHKTKNCILHT